MSNAIEAKNIGSLNENVSFWAMRSKGTEPLAPNATQRKSPEFLVEVEKDAQVRKLVLGILINDWQG